MDWAKYTETFFVDGLKVTPKLDGILVLGESLKIVKPVSRLRVNFPVQMKPTARSELKGCKLIGSTDGIWEIRIAESNDLVLSLLLWCADSSFVAYDRFGSIFCAAFNDAIESLRVHPDSVSQKWAGQQLDASISQQTRGTRFVYPGDFDAFSIHLSASLRERLEDSANALERLQLKFCFKAMEMGQCLKLKDSLAFLNRTRNREVEEVLVHFAFDMELAGKATFWRRSRLVKRMGVSKPDLEYYPLGLQGVGNFYFYSQTANIIGDSTVELVKFYNEYDKFWHSHKSFLKSQIADHLSKIGPGRKTLRTTALSKMRKFHKQADLLKRTVQDFDCRASSYARVEVVVSTLKPSFKWQYRAFGTAVSHLIGKEIFRKDCVIFMPPHKIKDRLRRYVYPVACTIESHLQRYMRAEQNQEFFDFTIQNYLDVSAAEAVASFMIYGTAVSQRGKYFHDTKLCRDLKLMKDAFTGGAEVDVLCVNPDLGNGRLVMGDRLQYSPGFDFSAMLELPPGNKFSEYQTCIVELSCGVFQRSAEQLLKFVVWSTATEQGARSTNQRSQFETTQRVYRKRCTLLTSNNFTDWLMIDFISWDLPSLGKHTQLVWFLKRFNEVTQGVGNFPAWRKHFAKFLEQSLIQDLQFLNFVAVKKCFIAVPFAGTQSRNLKTLNVCDMQSYLTMLMRVYKAVKGRSVDLRQLYFKQVKKGLQKFVEITNRLDYQQLSTITIDSMMLFAVTHASGLSAPSAQNKLTAAANIGNDKKYD